MRQYAKTSITLHIDLPFAAHGLFSRMRLAGRRPSFSVLERPRESEDRRRGYPPAPPAMNRAATRMTGDGPQPMRALPTTQDGDYLRARARRRTTP